MSASVRSSSINYVAPGTGVTTVACTGQATGDYMMVLLGGNLSGNTFSDNNGATPMTKTLAEQVESSGGSCVALFSRQVQGGDPTTWSFNYTSSTRLTAIAICIQNPNLSSPFDVTPASGNTNIISTGATSGNSNSITTLNANSIHIIGIAVDANSFETFNLPSGYTSIQSGVPVNNQPMAAAYKVIASPGATGAQGWTWTNSTTAISVSFAMRDQGGGRLVGGSLVGGTLVGVLT